MDKLIKMKGKLLVATALILAITLLSACNVAGANLSAIGDQITTTLGSIGNRTTTALAAVGDRATTTTLLTACHATGDLANPYEVITVTYDISPVPANGCPTNPVLISAGKITICHATGSQTKPYDEITVSLIGLNGHGTHAGDVFPLPDGGCPTTLGVIGNSTLTLTVCHATGDLANPYETLTVNSAELNVHRGHPNDIYPVPANGCPASPVLISDGKITICHATGSQTNPYNEITVSINGLNGHDKHAGDIIPAPAGGCSAIPVLTSGGMITICHATGSRTNPYNEITVSVNGLNGHDKHAGDIIPAPAGGCPTTNLQYKKPGNGKP